MLAHKTILYVLMNRTNINGIHIEAILPSRKNAEELLV